MVESARQETITNNLANSETAGFKKDLALQRAQHERNVVRIGDPGRWPLRPVIGTLGLGSLVDSIHTSHSRGNMLETGRELDLAVTGDGYFAVETQQGIRYTRNGAFTIDAERFLVNEQGQRVLGTDGPVRLAEGNITVDGDGRIFVNEVLQGRLHTASFANPESLRKVGYSLFAAADGQAEAPYTGQIRQGFLEGSNVQVVQEMVRMITAMRAYETNQRAVQAQDDLLGKAVNEIGSLR